MTILQPSRRRFLFGSALLLAAPAIVRAGSLMRVAQIRDDGVALSSIEHPYFGLAQIKAEGMPIIDDPWDLTEGSLERAIIDIRAMMRPTGQAIGIKPTKIWRLA